MTTILTSISGGKPGVYLDWGAGDTPMAFSWKRIVPTLAAAVVIATTLSLGFWQLSRAEERDSLAARQAAVAKAPPVQLGRETLADPQSMGLHPMAARGVWLPEKGIFLDNQTYRGVPGYHVLMPLQIEGTDIHVLVDRGWVAGTGDRRRLPDVVTPQGSIDVRGFARQSNFRFKELSGTFKEGQIWENVTVERFAAWSALKLQPVILLQTDDVNDRLVRDWPRAGSGADKNRAYAVQWFAMALLTAGLWAFFMYKGLRRGVADGE